MVDRDRIKDAIDDKKESESNSSSSRSKTGSERKSLKSEERELSTDEKMRKFKKGSGVDAGSEPSGKTEGTEDIKRLLFTLGSMELYTRTMKEYESPDMEGNKLKIKDNFVSDVSGEFTNFMGTFNVLEVAKSYGYRWERILEIIPKRQDQTGKSMKANDGNVSRDDVKELLDCIGNCILYVEGKVRALEDKENRSPREEVQYDVAEGMYDYYKDLLAKGKVQRISEKHGYDWKDDILKGVLEDQNFESKVFN